VLAGTIQRRGQPTGVWTYRDVDGRPVLKVFRFDSPDGKEFRPVHPVAGGWAAGDPPGPLPLYRRPELEAAARVYVAEGEKAADAVAALGLAATTSSHGAQSAAKTDWSALAGKEVILLPDCDAPGAGYAQAVTGLLAALDPRPTVKIVPLDQLWQTALPIVEGADIVEWLADGVPDSGPMTSAAARSKIGRRKPALPSWAASSPTTAPSFAAWAASRRAAWSGSGRTACRWAR
jgi:hypothetical protein